MRDQMQREKAQEVEQERGKYQVKTIEYSHQLEYQINTIRRDLLEEFRNEKQQQQHYYEDKLNKLNEEYNKNLREIQNKTSTEKEDLIFKNQKEVIIFQYNNILILFNLDCAIK